MATVRTISSQLYYFGSVKAIELRRRLSQASHVAKAIVSSRLAWTQSEIRVTSYPLGEAGSRPLSAAFLLGKGNLFVVEDPAVERVPDKSLILGIGVIGEIL